MAYRKFIKGSDNHDNQQNEQLSHNRITVEGGPAAVVLVVFLCILATASIILMAIIHLDLLESLIVATFIGFFVCLWGIALAFTIRYGSATRTAIAVDKTVRNRALVEQDVIYASEAYILFRDTDGKYQFRGTVHVDEHRQFLPKEISPPAPSEAILTCFDQGMSGRAIERWLKDRGDKKISYREIAKTLDLYRPGWNTRTTIDADSTAEE